MVVRLYSSDSQFVTDQRTGASGGYTLSGLAPASYQVCFEAATATGGKSRSGYADQCYKNVSWNGGQSAVPKKATAVPVPAGKTTTDISAALAASASISGTVIAATGGRALANVAVEVFNPSGTLVSVSPTGSGG